MLRGLKITQSVSGRSVEITQFGAQARGHAMADIPEIGLISS